MKISETAYWVAYYRAQESRKKEALFHDPLVEILVEEKGKIFAESAGDIGRYTEWAVIMRTLIIDQLIYKLLLEGIDTVINLGAGLDTRPYRLNLPKNFKWIEADFPEIIEFKNKKLKDSKANCELIRVGIDLTDKEARVNFLNNSAIDSEKVLILTEGVILYLKEDQVQELSADLINNLKFKFWICEYFHSRVYSYLQKSSKTKNRKESPFQFFPNNWFTFFNNLGWFKMDIQYIGEVSNNIKRKVPLPKLFEILWPILPNWVKNYIYRLAGYVIFKRKNI